VNTVDDLLAGLAPASATVPTPPTRAKSDLPDDVIAVLQTDEYEPSWKLAANFQHAIDHLVAHGTSRDWALYTLQQRFPDAYESWLHSDHARTERTTMRTTAADTRPSLRAWADEYTAKVAALRTKDIDRKAAHAQVAKQCPHLHAAWQQVYAAGPGADVKLFDADGREVARDFFRD
jgi:hypothetical protein